MNPSDYETSDLIKFFHSQRSSSQHLPSFAYEISKRNDVTQCVYVPARGKERQRCDQESSTPYGYCSKHRQTLQAKKIKQKYENALKEYVPQRETKKEKEEVVPQRETKKEKEEVPDNVEETNPRNERIKKFESFLQKSRGVRQVVETVDETPDATEETPEATEEETEEAETTEETSDESLDSKYAKKKTRKNDKKANYYEDDEVLQIKLSRNAFGNFEDKKTGIVFDIASKKAYGVQHPNGRVYSLGQKEKDFCRKHGWPYMIRRKVMDESSNDSESDDSDDSESYHSRQYERSSDEEESVEYSAKDYEDTSDEEYSETEEESS